jgi:hypothetical protein
MVARANPHKYKLTNPSILDAMLFALIVTAMLVLIALSILIE